ncbi:hypothetical protein CROQUDRAFT_42132 [Cronartium quercuum f. sp. fusiforme G11]|uniref:PIPK domain-containing protein n=1 Tax=Cronartium quercuum f. sp. fusiforme G11 TaxID=708437 RepID=A0A9P6NPL8_9BASI|nr:hypothetical protein CROQUDRAFT_42132 [Cronartium quercuum f. sp. fusiforme G11]
MITTWNMSEREALLNFAPTYFEYISSSTSMKPSVMCKILGFFTVKIKESGKNENMVKLDLLLMENLFHGQTITRKFDLKGITTRVAKVKPSSENGTTGWDADWIEGSLRTLLLIHPHSKHVIASAIENDTKFLAENNVMDYSLLVGVDDVRKELVVGMIDVIGTFNLAKMLESRGKMVLKSSDKKGEVTILPPIEYATRFRKAMETYFVAVPEKWSRPSETQTREREWQEDPSLASVF